MTLCIEPLNRFETDFINTGDQAIKMVKDVGSPNLKIHLDTFHMNIEEKDLAQSIRQGGQAAGPFARLRSDPGTPGNDHMDWPQIVKALKSIKYDGDMVIEASPGRESRSPAPPPSGGRSSRPIRRSPSKG